MRLKRFFLFCILICVQTALWAKAEPLCDTYIDRFILIVPEISFTVMEAWEATLNNLDQDLDVLQKNYERNDSLQHILAQKRLPAAMSKEIFTVMVGMIFISYQTQRDILENQVGHALTKEELVKEITKTTALNKGDMYDVQQTICFLESARQWLGAKNISLLTRRMGELNFVFADL